METNSGDEGPTLTVLESVRCLECGAIYAKPSGGGTAQQNPGCPECGYVGWIGVDAPIMQAWQPFRFAEDPLQRRGG